MLVAREAKFFRKLPICNQATVRNRRATQNTSALGFVLWPQQAVLVMFFTKTILAFKFLYLMTIWDGSLRTQFSHCECGGILRLYAGLG